MEHETTSIKINLNHTSIKINRHLYGHFAEHLGRCIYDGIWVGTDSNIPNIKGYRTDIIEALKDINIPNLRWPGGCFADDYHWEDGIGEPEQRPIRLNRWWNSLESNKFGTHEFLEFCELIGCDPYICGNVGSGTVREMSDWVEYLNCNEETSLKHQRTKNGHPEPYNVEYWGVGNENWGCGGNMCPQHYAQLYRRYSTYLNDYDPEKPLFKIACGANRFDHNWTDQFFASINGKNTNCASKLSQISGYAVHYYCGSAGTDTEYNEVEWYTLLLNAIGMEEIITEHRAIMDKYDPQRKIGLICDEWGAWHKPSAEYNERWLYQQNTIRDAMVAALTLDIFNNHADKIIMANLAQIVNVLQSLILTKGEKTILTPTYLVYKLYRDHQEAELCPIKIDTVDCGPLEMERIRGSCSRKGDEITLSLVNIDVDHSEPIDLQFIIGETIAENPPTLVTWDTLSTNEIHSHNTFENPSSVRIIAKDLPEPSQQIVLNPASINVLKFRI